MSKKEALRIMFKANLSSLSLEEHEKLSRKLSRNLLELLTNHKVIQQNLKLGVFAPIQKEPLWNLELESKYERITAYPAFESGEMVFRLATSEELENRFDFGVEIKGPQNNSRLVKPEIVLVPGLGFDTFGRRLGRGRGFYDRYLEKNTVVKIGLAFEMQMQKEIPCEDHDVLMDFIVTEKNIYKK